MFVKCSLLMLIVFQIVFNKLFEKEVMLNLFEKFYIPVCQSIRSSFHPFSSLKMISNALIKLHETCIGCWNWESIGTSIKVDQFA